MISCDVPNQRRLGLAGMRTPEGDSGSFTGQCTFEVFAAIYDVYMQGLLGGVLSGHRQMILEQCTCKQVCEMCQAPCNIRRAAHQLFLELISFVQH